MAISSSNTDFIAKDGNRKRKRSQDPNNTSTFRWKNTNEQNLYSSKLLEALRHVCRSNPKPLLPARGRAVREVADRALAIAARGRTRWSRAILTGRSVKSKSRKVKPACPARPVKSSAVVKKLSVVERKARALGRLVPGCGKLSFPMVLEETVDYIPALEMQVRAMSALVRILSDSGAGRIGSS